jgi:predicted ribosome quality control (RQC) complex YloA/Tae2 family protein
VELVDYYQEDCPTVVVKLNPALSASQNAQKYYKEYRKARTAEVKLQEQIQLGMEELEYVDSVFYALTEARTEQDLGEIRAELAEQGYLRQQQKDGKKKNTLKTGEPLKVVTEDGFTILIGRNNKQNDKLTLKDAKNNDYWFHTKNIHGSHVILVTEGRDPSPEAMSEAARLAALHSKAKDSSQVPVDYTRVRYVSKPQGAKPGMVIYVNYKTIYTNPTAN